MASGSTASVQALGATPASPSASPEEFTWFGGTGNFRRPNNWSPRGVPMPGDTALIPAGTVRASGGSLAGIDINIGSNVPVNDPILALRNETLGDVQVVTLESQPESDLHANRYGDITVAGTVTAAGAIRVGETSVIGSGVPGDLDIRLARGANLDVTGSLVAFAISAVHITGQPRSTLINDGQITAGGASVEVETPVSGNGTFVVGSGKFAGGTLTFDRSVSAGEHVVVDPEGTLHLSRPMAFLGSITQVPFSAVVLPSDFTSASYSNGILTVLDHHRTVAALHITAFDDMGFNVASVGGHTVISTPGPIGAPAVLGHGAMALIPTVHDPSI